MERATTVFVKDVEIAGNEVNCNSYLQLLTDLEKQMYEFDKLENFIRLCHNINCAAQSMESKIPEIFSSKRKQPFLNTNLVILACKLDLIDALKYILSEENLLYNVSERIGRNPIQYSDYDSGGHNAFYYAMQSRSTELIKTLIEKWPLRNFEENSDLLDVVLSKAYTEIKLRHVPLPDQMSVYVEGILVELRFFDQKIIETGTKKPNQGKKKRVFNPEPVLQRVDLVLEKIESISCGMASVDHIFLCTLKQIVQCIHVLKRQLRPTYDRIPWEEIEFILVAFLLSLTSSGKRKELNVLHGSVLNRKKIVRILENLAECLHDVKNGISKFQGSFLFPKMKRSEMKEKIMTVTSFSKEFYDNFEQVRDFFTLETINRCLSLASSANARDPHGQLVITRCLQVIGEHLKDTVESPKLSLSTGELLLSALPVATAEVLKALRDSLSHDDSLKARMDIEENSDSFFLQIQEDLKNLVPTVSSAVYEKKISLVLKMLEDILECDGLEEMKEKLGSFNVNPTIDADFEQGGSTGGVEKLESLLQKLFKEMGRLTKEEASLFAVMNSIIQSEKMKLRAVQHDFIKGYAYLSIVIQMVVSGNEVSGIKGYANQAHIFLSKPKDTSNLKMVLDPCKELFKTALSRVKAEGDIKIRILNDMLHVLQYEVDNTKWIQELRSQLTRDHAPTKKKKVAKPSNQYSDILQKKVRMLHTVLNSNHLSNNRLHESIDFYHRNQTLKALVEMLLLDIMSILQSNSRLSENPYFLDHDYPVLLGQNLRKHLAHENPIVRVLTNVDLDVLLTANAVANGIIEGCEDETDKVLKNEPLLVKSKFDANLKNLMVQQRLFESLAKGDILSIKNCIEEGADPRGRDPSLQTALHYAAMAEEREAMRLLVVEYGLDINATDVLGRNALHVSSEYGRVVTVKFLIDELNMNVNCVDKDERTPLLLSSGNGHLDVVEFLLLKEADASISDSSGSTPLQKSVENNHLSVLKVLLKNESDIDEGYGEFTPLYVAAWKGYVEMVDYLLSWGADVNKRTDEGHTALHKAALSGHCKVAEMLISKGAEVNAKGVRNETPLLHAAQNGHETVVRVLIEHNANLDPVEKMTLATPLHTAAGYGHLGVVKLLVEKGANIDARRLYGETALHQSIMHRHFEVAEFLIENGGSVNIQDSEDLTPLHICATAGHEGILLRLIHKGAKLDIKSKERFTALHIAAMYGHRNVAEILLKNGADVDAKDDTDSTPLHVCAHKGCSAVAEVLVEHRGNVNAVNSMGVSPVMVAASRGDAKLLKLFVSNGGKVDSRVLSLACFNGNTDAVQYLIDCDLDVNEPNNGVFPLHEAVRGNRKEVVEMLIRKGADVTVKNKEEDSPLMSAVKLNFKDIVSLLVPTTDEVDFNMLRVSLFFGTDILNILLKKTTFDFKDLNSQEPALLLHTAVMTGQKSVTEIVLEKGVPVDACINGDMTPLFTASTAGHSDVVNYLLSKNATVDFRRKDGATPLHPASLYGFVSIVEALLKAGADPLIRDREKRSAVEMAVLNNHLRVVQMLLEKTDIDINATGHQGMTLLHVASERGHLDMVKFLINQDADVNSFDSSGSKPIHLSAMQGQTEVVEFFLSSVLGTVDDLSSSGETPLHHAIYGRNLQMVKYLVDEGADVDIQDAFGSSIVHVSASMGQLEILRFLLEHGACYDVRNVRNMTPLQMADAYGRKDVVEMLYKTDELFEAVKHNDIQKVKQVLENAAAVVNAKNENHASPLHLAALNGYADITELLLENQAHPDSIGNNYYRPLHFASRYSHMKIAISLLKKGATYNAQTKDRKTPLELSPQKSPVSDLLELIDRSFKAVQNGESRILRELEGMQVHIVKAVFKTQNTDSKTLMAVGIRNDFPRIEALKRTYENAYKDFIKVDESDDRKLEDFFMAVTQKKSGDFGLDNPSALDMREDIALMFFRRQMFNESLRELQSIFLKRTETVGMGMEQLLTLRNIALVFFNQGNFQKALEIFRKVYKKQKDVIGENNSEVIESRSIMAMALDSVGEFDEALTCNLEILEILRDIKEELFPLYFKVMKNTGIVLMHLKRYYEALEIFQNVYKESESHSFIDHPHAFQVLYQVGTAFYELGNFKEALILFSKTLEKQKNRLGLNNLDTLRTYKSIGILFLSRGQCLSAYKIFKMIIGPMTIILGPNNPEIKFIVEKLRLIEIQVDIKDNKSYNNLKSFTLTNL